MEEILKILLLAMVPIGELRASIPVAIAIYHLAWPWAFLISVVGNIFPVIFLILFFEPVSKWLSRNFKIFNKFFTWLFNRTRKKAGKIKNKRYLYPALALFVALPLPLTGAWSGFLVSFLLGLPSGKSLMAISSGVIIAGAIVTIAVEAGVGINNYFGWKTLILLAIAVVAGYIIVTNVKTQMPKVPSKSEGSKLKTKS